MDMISTRQFRAFLGALALLGAFASQAGAAALMTYQGRLKESGVPVSGPKIIDIQLCTALTGGLCTTSGQQGVMVSSGLFRTTFTLPSNVDLAALQQWFLEVRVGNGPVVTLTPREELTAGPYAVFAATASGLAASNGAAGVVVTSHMFVVNGSRVGIGNETGSPAAKLHISSGGIIIDGTGSQLTVETVRASLANGSALTLRSTDGSGGTSGGFVQLVSGDGTSLNSPGGNISLLSGIGNTSARGGDISVTAGTGGGTAAGRGGDVTLTGGASAVGGGGAIHLKPGVAAAGPYGYVEIEGGAGAAHLRATQTNAPTIAGVGGCGAAPVIAVGSTDMHGKFTINTGGAPVVGCGAVITFNRGYNAAPKAVILTPAIDAAANPVTGGSPFATAGVAGFTATTSVVPGAGLALDWYYLVIE